MADVGGLGSPGLTTGTVPIFDDALYLAQALQLPTAQHEDDVDSRLALAAAEAGVEHPHMFLLTPAVQDISTSVSTMSLVSAERSSMSIHSRETQSTAFTSLPSRTSRDILDRSPSSRTPKSLMRASLSFDRKESVPDSPRLHRRSSSNFSTAFSLHSDASSRAQSATKPKRTSGLFSMFRKQSSACSSPSHQNHQSKPQSPKLDCGHSLSEFAIRAHVQEALEKKNGAAPTCCGQPLPRGVLNIVLTRAEVELVTKNRLSRSDTPSLRDSAYSESGLSAINLPLPLETTPPTITPPAEALISAEGASEEDQEAQVNLVLASDLFKELQAEQREELERVMNFEKSQRDALCAHNRRTLERLAIQLESAKIEKPKEHARQLERLDEFQLNMEHDLRNTHDTETQNVATALKYMEAYCAGPNPVISDITYTVTEDDRNKLERQRMVQIKLPAKQESAINVLRAKQERDTKNKIQKQKDELQQLDADYEKEKHAQELQYEKDCSQLETVIQARRSRIDCRWNLKLEIFRKQWEKETGKPLEGTLPPIGWPERGNVDDPATISNSLTLKVSA